MKKLLIIAMLAATSAAYAQTLNKVNNGINNADVNINNTENSIERVKGLFQSIKKRIPAKEVHETPSAQPQTAAAASPAAASTTSGLNKTTIVISKCDYNGLREIVTLLSADPDVQIGDKGFAGNMATITIMHKGPTDGIVDYIDRNGAGKYNITGINTGSISLVKI